MKLLLIALTAIITLTSCSDDDGSVKNTPEPVFKKKENSTLPKHQIEDLCMNDVKFRKPKIEDVILTRSHPENLQGLNLAGLLSSMEFRSDRKVVLFEGCSRDLSFVSNSIVLTGNKVCEKRVNGNLLLQVPKEISFEKFYITKYISKFQSSENSNLMKMSFLNVNGKIIKDESYLIHQLCLNKDSNDALKSIITLQINTEANAGVFFELGEW